MRPLEEIAESPRAATISENLVLVADPFGDFKRQHGGISPKIVDEIIEALKEKFIEGEGLVSRFRGELVNLESQRANFTPHFVSSVYEKLGLMLSTRPAHLVQQLQRLWRSRHSIEIGKTTLLDGEDAAFEVARYTHQWHQYVEKRRGPDPYESLKRIPEYGITVYMRENSNRGWPSYVVYGWQEKLKIRRRIVNKILYKLFEAMKNAEGNKSTFYQESFGTDYFGHKVIGASRNIDLLMGGFIYHPNSNWIPRKGDPEDYRISKGKEGKTLRALEYVLRYKHTQTTERVQLQVTTFPDFLLDEFFDKDSHPLFRVRRDVELRQHERKNLRLYDRMEKSMEEVLLFLPR